MLTRLATLAALVATVSFGAACERRTVEHRVDDQTIRTDTTYRTDDNALTPSPSTTSETDINLDRTPVSGSDDTTVRDDRVQREVDSNYDNMKSGAKEFGRDVKSGTKKVGHEIDKGTKPVRDDIKDGVNDLQRKF